MMPALFLAVFLGRPFPLVDAVYAAGGLDAVALVECESNFNPKAVRREPRGHSSYGLFQLDNEWHPQHREDLAAHIREGAAFLEECKGMGAGGEWDSKVGEVFTPSAESPATTKTKPAHSFAFAAAVYNGGKHPGAYSIAWGKRVQAKRDELVWWLAWRELREEGIAQGGRR